ncbi:MAG: sugar phosphate isomerase/epimerase [Candidatus Hydrogenedentes bacterium]|nr:sugar phosphate isomerase/epimerase [Candidatus Hydrogenedentota bacterium]
MPTISVMTFVFNRAIADGQLTHLGMLAALDEAGFDGVELPSTPLLDDPQLRGQYASFLAGSRLCVACIDGMCNFVAADAAARQRGVDALRAAIDLAALFECPIVLAAGSRLADGIGPDDGRAMIADGLNACLPAARDAGVTLAIEDFGVAPTLQCSAADCLAVLDAAPGLAFVFDTGNFYFAGEDPLPNFELLAPRTCHVHFKDWMKSDTPQIADVSGAALGAGLIPNRALLGRFQADTAVDSLSLEVGAPGPILDAVVHDLATLRSWLA